MRPRPHPTRLLAGLPRPHSTRVESRGDPVRALLRARISALGFIITSMADHKSKPTADANEKVDGVSPAAHGDGPVEAGSAEADTDAGIDGDAAAACESTRAGA